MTTVEERVSRLEGVYEQIAERLNDQARLLEGLDSKIDRLGHRVYIIGAALWATMAAGLFAIAAGFINSGG